MVTLGSCRKSALASSGGFHRIKEATDRAFASMSDKMLVDIFEKQIIPLSRLLSLKSVDRSAMMEGKVASIHVFLYGVAGRRALALFAASSRYLENIIQPGATEDHRLAADSILAVLFKVIEVNSGAQINSPLVETVKKLSTCLHNFQSSDGKSFSRMSHRHLEKIEQRLGIASTIKEAAGVGSSTEKATFEVVRDLPGELSRDGPRHDNDHADIRRIKIMPTLEEIQASRNNYLPSFDPTEWHVEGIGGLLDRHFRLVRADTVGQLADAAKFQLEAIQDPHGVEMTKTTGTRTHVYKNLRFEDHGFDSRRGLEFVISFDQLPHLTNKSSMQRQQVWEDSKRLGPDALVCLLDAAGSATFLVVSVPMKLHAKSREASHNLDKLYTLYQDPRRAYAIVRFMEYNENIAKQVCEFFDSHRKRAVMSLVEFPGILVPAFLPTLKTLQDMSANHYLPFADIILQRQVAAVIPPPAYATAPDFAFDLRALTDGPADTLKLDGAGGMGDFDRAAFKANTSLDSGQVDALLDSLSRSMALVQGPPGTGKSYTGVGLIRVLLDNKAKGDLGPIICICYTNHALDQLLEHLVDSGVKQVIRIGSRSKSERLSNLNLRVVAQQYTRTKLEGAENYRIRTSIAEGGSDITEALDRLSKIETQKAVEDFLLPRFPEQHSQLFGMEDTEGFKEVDYHLDTRLPRWLSGQLYSSSGTSCRPMESLRECDLRMLSLNERRTLYLHWLSQIRNEIRAHYRPCSANTMT